MWVDNINMDYGDTGWGVVVLVEGDFEKGNTFLFL
jgi:hypothetical protein